VSHSADASGTLPFFLREAELAPIRADDNKNTGIVKFESERFSSNEFGGDFLEIKFRLSH